MNDLQHDRITLADVAVGVVMVFCGLGAWCLLLSLVGSI